MVLRDAGDGALPDGTLADGSRPDGTLTDGSRPDGPELDTAVACSTPPWGTHNLRCSGDQIVFCDDDRTEVTVDCLDDGYVCRTIEDIPQCVVAVSSQCTGVSARCVSGTALNCLDPTQVWEIIGECSKDGLECAIVDAGSFAGGSFATCKQPGAAPCSFGDWPQCFTLGCANGLLSDCCNGFVWDEPCPDAKVCVETTHIFGGSRICLAADYQPCDPLVDTPSCDGNIARNCFNYVEETECLTPNGNCTVIETVAGPRAACLADTSWQCDPGERGMGCIGGPNGTTHEKICASWLDGWQVAVPCPYGCSCWSGYCEDNLGGSCEVETGEPL